MKAKKLAEMLMKNPDFEVEFTFTEDPGDGSWPTHRTFENIEIADIGHSSMTILITGEER